MFFAQNFRFDKSIGIAFDQLNANGPSPNSYNDRKREQIGGISEMSSLFFGFGKEKKRFSDKHNVTKNLLHIIYNEY